MQILTAVFSKISSGFTNLLNTFAGLMVFTCIINGICGLGSVSEFSKIGRKMIGRYLLSTFVCTVFGMFVFLLLYHIPLGHVSNGKSQVFEVFNLIFNILPENPVKPFLELNTLQIALIAVFIGLMMLVNIDRVSFAKSFFQDFNVIVGDAIRIICKLPLTAVFLSFLASILLHVMAWK